MEGGRGETDRERTPEEAGEEEVTEWKNRQTRGERKSRKGLTVLVLCDALEGDAKEGGVAVVVPHQQLRPPGDVHAGLIENTGPVRGRERNISFHCSAPLLVSST